MQKAAKRQRRQFPQTRKKRFYLHGVVDMGRNPPCRQTIPLLIIRHIMLSALPSYSFGFCSSLADAAFRCFPRLFSKRLFRYFVCDPQGQHHRLASVSLFLLFMVFHNAVLQQSRSVVSPHRRATLLLFGLLLHSLSQYCFSYQPKYRLSRPSNALP